MFRSFVRCHRSWGGRVWPVVPEAILTGPDRGLACLPYILSFLVMPIYSFSRLVSRAYISTFVAIKVMLFNFASFPAMTSCAKSAKCDADVEVSPCSLKNTSLTFSILYSIYILIHRSSDIPPQNETSRRSITAEIIHAQMNMTIYSRFILSLHEMFFPYSFAQSLPSRQSK